MEHMLVKSPQNLELTLHQVVQERPPGRENIFIAIILVPMNHFPLLDSSKIPFYISGAASELKREDSFPQLSSQRLHQIIPV